MTKKSLLCVGIIFTMIAAGLRLGVAQSPPASNASYAYVSTATTTTVRGNGGFLNTVVINGGTAGVVTLYDIGAAGCTGTPASGKFATIETISTTNPVSLITTCKPKTGFAWSPLPLPM